MMRVAWYTLIQQGCRPKTFEREDLALKVAADLTYDHHPVTITYPDGRVLMMVFSAPATPRKR